MNRCNTSSLVSLDLLPNSYRKRRRVRQLRRSWTTVVMILLAVFCAALGESVLSSQRQAKRNAELACIALPIQEKRHDVIALQERNRQHEQWCAQVESAKPDDSALQTLAGIAQVSQQGNRDILIDALQVRLQVESPLSAESTDWSVPQLSIRARATNSAAQANWFDRLDQLDRIEGLAIDGQKSNEAGPVRLLQEGLLHLQLNGTPLATRVLP